MHHPLPHPLTRLLLVATLLSAFTACRGEPTASRGLAVHTVCGRAADTLEGIDVSRWQGAVEWNAVKGDGIGFAFARVSDGINTPDVTFATNWSGMQQAGLIRGAYQFFRPSQDVDAQADLVINSIADAGGLDDADLPPVLDVETNSGQSASVVAAAIGRWIARIEQQLRRRPIIYAGSYFWDDSVASTDYASYPLWTAHYTSASCPYVPDAWQGWTFWQYTDSGAVAGVDGDVDRNRFDGDLPALQAFVASTRLDENPCVPNGPEICDGEDNDCNGAIDDGDPGGGGACTTTVQGELVAGIEHCVGGALLCQATAPADDGGIADAGRADAGLPDATASDSAPGSGGRLIGGCALGGGTAPAAGSVLWLGLALALWYRRRRAAS